MPTRLGRPNKPVILPAAKFVCDLPVSPWIETTSRLGTKRSTWPGLGTEGEFADRLIPCGYRSQIREQHVCHLVATHMIPLKELLMDKPIKPERPDHDR